MSSFIIRRLLQMVVAFIGTTFIVYALMFKVSGDPIQALAGEKPISPSQRAQLTAQFLQLRRLGDIVLFHDTQEIWERVLDRLSEPGVVLPVEKEPGLGYLCLRLKNVCQRMPQSGGQREARLMLRGIVAIQCDAGHYAQAFRHGVNVGGDV
mgnify:CR=1 FL=1